MISSLLISQLIDERRLRRSASALPGQCMMLQPEAHPMNLSLARHSPADIDQAFLLLPGRMGIKTSCREAGAGPELPLQEGKPDPNPRKGFSSITITARRVVPPASTLMWGTAVEPLCSQCGAKEKTDSSGDREPPPRHRLFSGHGSLANGLATSFKTSEPHGQVCEGHPCWILNPENKENELIPPAIPSHGEKVPLLFSSCVHLRVSQPCSNTVHYLDKSLSIPLDQAPLAGSKVHKSVLSLNLSCSSHGLTADGADRMANAEEEAMGGEPLSQKHAEQHEKRSPTSWAPDFKESCLKESPPWSGMSLGNYPCPWSSAPHLGSTEDPGEGADPLAMGKTKGDSMVAYHARSHPDKLSIHIPGWSYAAGDYRCCDLVVKLKKYERPVKEEEMIPESPPAPAEPMSSPEKPDAAQEQDVCPEAELNVFPVHSLTLREALEVYKPQFISRSQERLRKLESMAQQRKAQGCETPRKKPSPLPLRPTKKKQYTIPHPLSDNLFKPKERCISEKEMHMRSKRIYNNLPEVKKKKEEQKKRVILQSNRLRVEVFKKQLLDQILQRSKERSAIPFSCNSGDLE